MRWDYGKVYKEIRKSKHLTQKQVCGDYLNRSTLVRFEKNETIPSYEHMRFLLKQVDMTFEEFEYLCNHYQPSERQQLLYDIDNLKSPSSHQLEELVKKCHNQLAKEPDDIPIQRRYLILATILTAKKSKNFQETNQEQSKLLWEQIIKNDNWYYHDTIIIGSLLHTLPPETIEKTSNLLLKRLEKYHDFKRIKPSILSLYQFLSYFFLDLGKKDKSLCFTHKFIALAKQEKRYDQLARGYVYLGIINDDVELISKGLSILDLTDEQYLLNNLKSLIKKHQYNQKPD